MPIFILLLAFCHPFAAGAAEESPQYTSGTGQHHEDVCRGCGQPILGGYIKADGYKFHHACFTCSHCGKPISGSYQHESGQFYHPDCFKKAKGLVCARCGKLLHKRWQVLGDKKFHARCLKEHLQETRLKCDLCGKPITGKYTKDQSRNYHIECYRKHNLHKCAVCSQPIEGRMLVDPWGNRAHPQHGGHPTTTCSSCSRIISHKTSKGGYRYSDGRTLCGFCQATVVDQNHMVMQSRNTVLATLHSIGITNIPADIPIHIVHPDHLRQQAGNRHPANAKGFTQCVTRHRNGQAVQKNQAIYILTGLPRLEFNGVLAHEMMHVWLNEHGIAMPAADMEGFCNLGAMKIYQDDGSAFARVLLENMETDPDSLYGDGYRKWKAILQNAGWSGLIRQVRAGL